MKFTYRALTLALLGASASVAISTTPPAADGSPPPSDSMTMPMMPQLNANYTAALPDGARKHSPGQCLDIHMWDTYGDGFPDASVTLAGPNNYRHGPFQGILGFLGTEMACDIVESGCYSIMVSACVYESEPSLKLGEGTWIEGWGSSGNGGYDENLSENPALQFSDQIVCGSTMHYAIQYANTTDMKATRVFDPMCSGFDFTQPATPPSMPPTAAPLPDETMAPTSAPITFAPTVAPTTMAPTMPPLPQAAITLNMPAAMNLEMAEVPPSDSLSMRVLVSGLERSIRAVFNSVDYKYDVNILTVDGVDITQFAMPVVPAMPAGDDSSAPPAVAPPADSCLDFNMWDSYGDGFSDANVIFTGPNGHFTTFPGITNAYGVAPICDFPVDGCYAIEVTMCSYAYEPSYALGGADLDWGCGNTMYYAVYGTGTADVAAFKTPVRCAHLPPLPPLSTPPTQDDMNYDSSSFDYSYSAPTSTTGGATRKLEGACLKMEMMDSWGDGFLNEMTDGDWYGEPWTGGGIEVSDSTGTVISTFDGIDGWSDEQELCEIVADGCYTVSVPECNWGWEASWRLGYGDFIQGCGSTAFYYVAGAGTSEAFAVEAPDAGCSGMADLAAAYSDGSDGTDGSEPVWSCETGDNYNYTDPVWFISCDMWAGYNCYDAGPMWGLKMEEVGELFDNCPNACGTCWTDFMPPALIEVPITFEVLTENLCMTFACDGVNETFVIPEEVIEVEFVLNEVVARPEFPEMVKASMNKKAIEMVITFAGESNFTMAEENEIWDQTMQDITANFVQIDVADAFLMEIVSIEESWTLGGSAASVGITTAVTIFVVLVALVIM